MKVHITGFSQEEKTYISQLAKDLNLTVEENFNTSVEIVVVKLILVQKYRLAKILNLKIVSKKWIIDSYREQKILPINNYETGPLQDLKIFLYGFDPFLSKQIEETAIHNQAKIIKNIEDLKLEMDMPKFVVYKDEQSINSNDPEYKILHELRSQIFIVNYDWFLTCLREERFIQTDYFLHSMCKLSLPKIRIRVEPNDLETLLNEQDVNANHYNVLESCVFYFHKADNSMLNNKAIANHQGRQSNTHMIIDTKLQSKLINLLGGFCVSKKIKNITHVICSSIDEADMKTFKKNGNVYFVTDNYVKDCLLYKKRLLEIEYPSVIIPISDTNSNVIGVNSKIDEKQSSVSGTYTQMSLRTPTSMTFNNKNVPKFKSFLFENLLFYFDKGLKSLKELQCNVLENSGDILIELKSKKIKHDKLFYVLDDGFDVKNYKKIESSIPNVKIIFISPRWINYCLERKIVIRDIKASRLPHLLPFIHEMPLNDFMQKNITLKGFGPTETYGLEELIKVIGAKLVDTEELELDNPIIICDKPQEYNFSDKYTIKPAQWLFECISAGKYI